jgi:anaerobic ribonucleoside-triphosphate reductase activating protein
MKYLKITSPDIENGPGCRVTLWIPGCTHKCPGCHNAWTADYNQGKEFTTDDFEYLKSILDKPYIKGLTISGGDPLDQDDQTLIDLIQLCFDISLEYPTKDIWLYTGYYKEDLKCKQLELLNYIDVLVDGPFEMDKRDITLPFRGSTNQRIIKLHNNCARS